MQVFRRQPPQVKHLSSAAAAPWWHVHRDFLRTPMTTLPGVGPQLNARLARAGIKTFWDLLKTRPSKYRTYAVNLAQAQDKAWCGLTLECVKGPWAGKSVAKAGPAGSSGNASDQRKGRWHVLCRGRACGSVVQLTFFHPPKIPFTVGSLWHVRGQIRSVLGSMRAGDAVRDSQMARWEMVHPDFVVSVAYAKRLGLTEATVMAEYPLVVRHLGWGRVRGWIQDIMHQWGALPWPSQDISGPVQWMGKLYRALRKMHLPKCVQEVDDGASVWSVLAAYEMVGHQLAVVSAPKSEHGWAVVCAAGKDSQAVQHVLQAFGHDMTPSQAQAWQEIAADMAVDVPMARLLHADVGAGKSLVAFLALVHAASCGYQACLMAPTETLARQHFQTLSRLTSMPVQLWLGQRKPQGPKDAKIFIGTHALLYDRARMNQVALVIIDEQQRFGVLQRLALMKKGHDDVGRETDCHGQVFKERGENGKILTEQRGEEHDKLPLQACLMSGQAGGDIENWATYRFDPTKNNENFMHAKAHRQEATLVNHSSSPSSAHEETGQSGSPLLDPKILTRGVDSADGGIVHDAWVTGCAVASNGHAQSFSAVGAERVMDPFKSREDEGLNVPSVAEKKGTSHDLREIRGSWNAPQEHRVWADHVPHMLCLTATPIPRTFQRTLWGGMKVSTLHTRPGCQPVPSEMMPMQSMDKVHQMIEACIKRRESVYWVCPAIDDEDHGVYARTAYWQQYFGAQVGMLHGRMKPEEKECVLQDFAALRTPLLISTTVIEVGVDVASAALMVVEESPRFGLAQLHQLRGRVGRNPAVLGRCIFLYTAPLGPASAKRLRFLCHCRDGFQIAEHDWQIRGAGTPLGTYQSGDIPYVFFCPIRHRACLRPSLHQAEDVWCNDPAYGAFWMDLFGYGIEDIHHAG